MRRPVLWVMALSLLLGGLGVCPVQAEPLKPVAVVSIASYDEIMGDLDYVGKIADRPELAAGAKGMLALVTGGRGLEGLDKTKPLGVIVQTDGDKFFACVCLPVTDLKKLLEVVEPMVGKITAKEDGVFEVRTNDGKTLYVKDKGRGWAMASDNEKGLANAPADPTAAMGKLSHRYDLAVRLYVHNVPEKHRQKLIEQIKEKSESELQQKPGEDDTEYAIRKKVAGGLVDAAITAINELEQVSFGWSLDHKAEKAYVEASTTALPGTEAAEALNKLGQTKSEFAGLLLPDAAIVGNWLGVIPSGDAADLAEVVNLIRPKAMEQIQRKAKSDEEAKVQKELVGGLLDVIQKTLAKGRVDKAMSLVLKPKAVTLVAGGYVADGPTLEKTLKELTEAARKHSPDFVNQAVKLDAGQVRGVNLHTVSIPVPPGAPDREKAVQLIGETLDVVIGIGRESVYVAAGRDAMKTLKEAIERSTDTAGKLSPMKLSVALGPIAKFVSEVGPPRANREKAARAAEALSKMSGKDHISLVVDSIDRGLQVRFEAEPDVLKLIGVMAKEHKQESKEEK